MKLSKTFFFAIFTVLVILAVYIFDYRAEVNQEKIKQALILNNDPDQITYVQIIKPEAKIALQKTEFGWDLLEPIQDSGDRDNIEELLKDLAKETQISIVKESATDLTDAELREFGLDKPSIVFNFKNNSGHTKKISVGSVKNFEGNSYIRIDSENKIIIAGPQWYAQSENDTIHYREKKLYRHSLAKVIKIKVKSLRDKFELQQIDGKWFGFEKGLELDQNKIREILKKLSQTSIVQYVFEGEPSVALLKEKGLDKNTVDLELITENSSWSVSMKVNSEDKALYALTERPTFLVKIDIPAWETFGNLNLDELRDRTSALSFNLKEVQKIYYKHNDSELNIISTAESWKPDSSALATVSKVNNDQVKKTIQKIHDLKISEFVDSPKAKEKFEGKNMLILKSATEKLVLQLNWGPSFKIKKDGVEKEYYYARSHLSDSIFALEKKIIDSLEFDKIISENKFDAEKEKVGKKIE